MTQKTRKLSQDEIKATDSSAFFSSDRRNPNLLQRFLIGLARSTPLHRGKMRHWMTRLIMRVGRQPFDTQFRDCTFRIEGQNNLIEYGILLNPGYNALDIEFLLEGLPVGGTALDIGSNIGLYSLPMAQKAGPSGKVISIDANPSMAERLLWNARASNIANISMQSCAVGEHEGKVELTIRKNDVAIVAVEETDQGSIQMRSLKSIVEDEGIKHIDALKIDIEGYEDKALAPFLHNASDALRPERIVIEHVGGTDYPDCAAAFEQYGYRLDGRSRNNSFYLKD